MFNEVSTGALSDLEKITKQAFLSTFPTFQRGDPLLVDEILSASSCQSFISQTQLYFEGDSASSFRLIRAIKNRFGAVNEIGVFAMTETGLVGKAVLLVAAAGTVIPGIYPAPFMEMAVLAIKPLLT